MRDEAIAIAPHLSAAEAAVIYVLKRVKVDADLRHHMLHTEAFSRLCQAEAAQIGKTEDEVMDNYSTPAEHCKDEKPKLVICRQLLDEIAEIAEDHFGYKDLSGEAFSKISRIARGGP